MNIEKFVSSKLCNKMDKILLTEMPYIQYDKVEMFDLELEKYAPKSKSDDEKRAGLLRLIDKINRILDGQTYHDKYGDTIHLINDEEKLSFYNEIMDRGSHHFMPVKAQFEQFGINFEEEVSKPSEFLKKK